LLLGAATDHDPQRRIAAETLGIIDILVAGQATVDGLAQEGQEAVLGVQPGARVQQAAHGGAGQSEGVVEFAVGKESGVTGDGRTVELELDFAIKIDAEGVILAVTHWVSRSFRQESVGNAGFSREKAQTPCRNGRAIWEIRAQSTASALKARPAAPAPPPPASAR
jgi:hypothetical protein